MANLYKVRTSRGELFTYDAELLEQWYMPQDLWNALPDELQFSVSDMQYAGAAVLTGFKRCQECEHPAASSDQDECLEEGPNHIEEGTWEKKLQELGQDLEHRTFAFGFESRRSPSNSLVTVDFPLKECELLSPCDSGYASFNPSARSSARSSPALSQVCSSASLTSLSSLPSYASASSKASFSSASSASDLDEANKRLTELRNDSVFSMVEEPTETNGTKPQTPAAEKGSEEKYEKVHNFPPRPSRFANRRYSIRSQPPYTAYNTELTSLRREALPHLRHTARSARVECDMHLMLKWIPVEVGNSLKEWLMEMQKLIDQLDNQVKDMVDEAGMSRLGLGWTCASG